MGWEFPPRAALHFTATNDERRVGSGGNSGEAVVLEGVTINTPVAAAILTIYQGPFTGIPSTTGTKVATIDCSTKPPTSLEYHIRCANGLYAQLTGAGADVTVTYT